MNNYTGRRKYKRIELEKWKYKEIVSPCITRFRVKQCDGQETSSLEWNIVAVKNLSAGGIMFNYYKMDLGFGSLLELKLDFIKSKPTISCIGRVVRIEDAHTNCMFRIATEFTEINDLDREIINTTVEAILKREAKISKLEVERETKIAERKAEQEAKIAKREADREAKITDKTSGITETRKKAVLGKEVYGYHGKSRETTQKESHATSFIITYMVLMLILGFIVHRDLTKQLNSVETRLDNIVSKVVNSGF